MTERTTVPNFTAAYQEPKRYLVSVKGGFDKTEAAIMILIWILPLIPGVTFTWSWNHPVILLAITAAPFFLVWALRRIDKDGRDLSTWAKDACRYYFHRQHPTTKRAVVNHHHAFPPGRVNSTNLVSVPNMKGGPSWLATKPQKRNPAG